MEYYSARKNENHVVCRKKWMELKIILLSKMSKTKKDKCFLSYPVSRFFSNKKDMNVTEGLFKKNKATRGGGRGQKRVLGGLNMIKLHYICV
jgi:hypothetical protein